MEKQTYFPPTVEFCEVMIECSFASSPTGTGSENLGDGGNW